jgi:hypothetical protein
MNAGNEWDCFIDMKTEHHTCHPKKKNYTDYSSSRSLLFMFCSETKWAYVFIGLYCILSFVIRSYITVQITFDNVQYRPKWSATVNSLYKNQFTFLF